MLYVTVWIIHPYAANIVFTVRGQICQYALQARFRTFAVERAYSIPTLPSRKVSGPEASSFSREGSAPDRHSGRTEQEYGKYTGT